MADTLGWRWEFGVQIPPLVALFAVAAVSLPPELGIYAERESLAVALGAFDFRGLLLLAASTTFLILGLNLGGNVLPCKFLLPVSREKKGEQEILGTELTLFFITPFLLQGPIPSSSPPSSSSSSASRPFYTGRHGRRGPSCRRRCCGAHRTPT